MAGAECKDIAAADEKEPVKSKEDFEALYNKCRSGTHVAVCRLCKDMIHFTIIILVTGAKPIRKEHGLNAQRCRDQVGVG